MPYPIVTNKEGLDSCLAIVAQLPNYKIGIVGSNFEQAKGFVRYCGSRISEQHTRNTVLNTIRAEIRFHHGGSIVAIPNSESARGRRFNEIWQISEDVNERFLREVLLSLIFPYQGGAFAD